MTTTDKAMTQYSLATAPAFVGRDLGVSDWVIVDQDRIDQFAALVRWSMEPTVSPTPVPYAALALNGAVRQF